MTAVTPELPPRPIGRVNWLGLWTHYVKEVHRFWKVGFQTLVAPMITTLLFLAVFTLALGRAVESINGVLFEVFLAPGLMMFAIIQNSFANTSSSMLILKIQGSIVDLLMPPLTAGELTVGFIAGSVTRGVAVGTLVGLVMYAATDMTIVNPWIIIFYGVSASVMLSLLGLITAIWADKFDNIASITNFIIVPLSFLSGTFYSIDRLPEFWRGLATLNPFFYMIDGFRAGFVRTSDAPILTGVILITVLNVVLWVICHMLFKRGYKLKS